MAMVIAQTIITVSLPGATLASVVRKAPNCFNLLRQMEVMQRSGCKASADKILEAAVSKFEIMIYNLVVCLLKRRRAMTISLCF